jgi:pimeloyl-ACP methyl ester carboxylesterase
VQLKDLLFKYTTDHSRFLVIDHMMVHYRDEGKGPTILLLHGAFSSLHTFNEWNKILKNKYRVIRLDLMGFGLTGPNDNGDYSMENFIRVLKSFVQILELDQFHLGGSSLGGWLAWEFAYRFPQKVDKLILINAAGFLEEENIPLPFKLAKTPIFNQMIKYVVKKTIIEQFVKQVFFDSSKVNEAIINRYYDLFSREGNPEAFLKMASTVFSDDSGHLHHIHNKTLIMWGREDMWIPVHNAYRFHKMLLHSKVKVYPEVGHIPMEEIPEISANDVIQFLEEEGEFRF